jgi:hypothetical protein
MTPTLFTISAALLLLLATAGPTALAVECAHGANHAGPHPFLLCF